VTMQLGIVGLPNVGKSTLFNALTRANALVANYPFTTIEPNVGVVPVPDQRLYDIAEIIKPQKTTPTTLRLVDIAGLVKGAHLGEGLGNQFLGHIRGVDAIAMVVRCFSDPQVPHTTSELDPVGDIAIIELELALADLATVERRLEKVRIQAKSKPRDFQGQIKLLTHLHDLLASGASLRCADLSIDERQMIRELSLLTGKPCMYIANVSESELPDGEELAWAVVERADVEKAQVVIICAQLEADLADWPLEEACIYRQELGLSESALGRVVRAGYRLLDLITFFTTTGGKEVRAWTLRNGLTALDAAGSIHTDMQRGFIRAEVVSFGELVRAGSLSAARGQGLIRLEGKDYPVRDGDVIHVRFNV